jgi:hypothetical protein
MPAIKNGEPISQTLTVEYPFQFHRIESGSLYELRKLSRVYVDTGTNLEEQRSITGEVLKYLPELKFVDTAEEADIILAFSASQGTETGTHVEKNVWSGEKIREWNIRVEMEIGDGQVLRRVNSSLLRSVLKFHDPQHNMLERKPSTNFARAFVKAYKQANGLGEK